MKKIAIITTHPIQYYAPWFKLLAEENKVDLKVFYTWSQSKDSVKDKTFGRDIKWDIPLLEGYNYEFVPNVSKKPGSHHFFGIDNPTIKRQIKNFNPGILLFIGWNFKSHLSAMRYFHGKVPVWFRGDSTLIDETPGFKTTLRRAALKQVYRYVDKALFVGTANKAYFIKHGLKDEQLIYAPHAIDNERFFDSIDKNYQIKANQWRKELGYKKNDLVLLFAGKFEEKKQPDFLINALVEANLQRENPVHLLMAGNGPLESELKSLAKDHHYIQFIPFVNQSQMPVLYRVGDIFCLPSRGPGETWGLAVNEAMASGRSVILSDKVGCSTDLGLAATNIVFDHSSINELTDIIKTLNKESLNLKQHLVQNYIANWSFLNIVNQIVKNLS